MKFCQDLNSNKRSPLNKILSFFFICLLCQTATAVPENDAFSDAIFISGSTGRVTGTNVDASGEVGEEEHAGEGGNRSVWWSWTAPEDGPVSFFTNESDFDTVLAVYRGNSLFTLAEVASNDDASDGVLTSAVSFEAFSGVVYHIAVDGYDGDTGNIVLTWSSETPSNDDFTNRIALTGEVGQTTANNINASHESGEWDHANIQGENSLWWTWIAPRSGFTTVDTYGSSFDTVLAVYVGDSLDSLRQVNANDDFDALLTMFGKKGTISPKYFPENVSFKDIDLTSTINFYVEEGTKYVIAVDGVENSAGTIVLNWNVDDPPAFVPPNDNFENRITLEDQIGQTTGSNINATKQVGEAFHASEVGGRSIWWTWTSAVNSQVTFDTVGGDFDTTLAVYTGNSLSTLSEVISNDDIGIPVNSRVTFQASAGTVYQIAVDSFSGDFGNVTLNWTDAVPPNDDFVNRIGLSGASGQTAGWNINAGRESGEPALNDTDDVHSVWWGWSASGSSDSVTFDTIGSNFETLIAVFTGDSVNSLNLITSNVESEDRRITFEIIPGNTYHILVGGKEGSAGDIVLNWDNVSPNNDQFEDRITLEGHSGETTGSTIGATNETSEPDHAGSESSHSIWWSWTAPKSREVAFNTHGSSYDTTLAIYRGESVLSLSEVASNDDDPNQGGLTSAVTFNAIANNTYVIAVDGYSGDSGNVVLQWSFLAPKIRIAPSNLTFIKTENVTLQSTLNNNQSDQAFLSTNSLTLHPDNPPILLKTGTIHTEKSRSSVGLNAISSTDRPDSGHVLLQFQKIPTPKEKQRLADQGIKLLRYIPNNAYWASVQKQAPSLNTLSQGGGVQWIMASKSVDKLSLEAKAGKFPPNTKLRNGRVEIWVLVFSDVDALTARIQFENYGAEILGKVSDHVYRLAVDPFRLNELSSLDIVEWVETGPPPKKENNAIAALRNHSFEVHESPYSLTGAGVIVGIWDGGRIFDHRDFGDRLRVIDSGSDISDHATHVAGTIGGSGLGDSQAKGMAPGVEIFSFDWDSDVPEMREYYNQGVHITNHSYDYIAGWETVSSGWRYIGGFVFGLYSTYSYVWDDLVWDTGLLTFRAASNDRDHGPDWPQGPRRDGPYDTITSGGCNKNGITVGATTDDDQITVFSSWGPTNDGRIKPDLCSNGTQVKSTVSDNEYDSFTGTSMASPGACGTGALLFEMHKSVTGEEPLPETMKALMFHGARDLGNPGPDYSYGWGLIDTRESADLIMNRMWNTGTVSHGETITYQVEVPTGQPELKATLVWTDPPASPLAAKSLVNDLDLLLRSPSGTIHYPWVLDKDNPSANATKGINTIDIAEQVLVKAPEAGQWTIEVQGTSITQEQGRFALVSEMFAQPGSNGAFWIFNEGAETLSINSITIENKGMDGVSIFPEPPFNVAPASYRKVSISVDFTRIGNKVQSAQLNITSNDVNNSPYPDGVTLKFHPEDVDIKSWRIY